MLGNCIWHINANTSYFNLWNDDKLANEFFFFFLNAKLKDVRIDEQFLVTLY